MDMAEPLGPWVSIAIFTTGLRLDDPESPRPADFVSKGTTHTPLPGQEHLPTSLPPILYLRLIDDGLVGDRAARMVITSPSGAIIVESTVIMSFAGFGSTVQTWTFEGLGTVESGTHWATIELEGRGILTRVPLSIERPHESG